MKSKTVLGSPFGDCPLCGENDGYRNIGPQHWMICNVHRLKWIIGENLFSSWRHEDETKWERTAWILSTYNIVEPIFRFAEDEEKDEEKDEAIDF